MASLISRITTSPDICGGRPSIRNMRIRVSDILDLLAAGETRQISSRIIPILRMKILLRRWNMLLPPLPIA